MHLLINLWFIPSFCYLQNLLTAQKQEAAKHCGCTIADVENALAKFLWAKEAQKKIEKLKEEGKPMPKSFAEVILLITLIPCNQLGLIDLFSGRNFSFFAGSLKTYHFFTLAFVVVLL